MRIIDDLSTGRVNSRDLNKASDIEAYFDGLPRELQPDGRTDRAAKPVSELTVERAKGKGKSSKKGDGKSTRRRTRQTKGKRRTLAPRRVTFAEPLTEKAVLVLDEATRIQLANFEISAAFLLRAFLELTLRTYAKKHKIALKDGNGLPKKLQSVGDAVRKHIIASSSNDFETSDLRPFQTQLLTSKSEASIQSLNSFIHSSFAIPTADALRSAWEACGPVFIATYGEA